MMTTKLNAKVLRIAAEICWRHFGEAGDRICQDWEGDTTLLDALTANEQDKLMEQYEGWNSQGADYEAGYFPYDEMVISGVVARHLQVMAQEAE